MKPAQLTRRAQRDVAAAMLRIAADSPRAARRFQALVRELAVRLGEYPESGFERPQIIGPPFRLAAVRDHPYLAIYDASAQPVLIARVLHGAQDLPNLLRDLPSPQRPETS
ncbi:type II toxin-antitoxin system RelE/ParE family toxin [Caulobacter sp. 602-2]|uniref:type II toxin-antitoxin system RelE/ParE family toxin n=1 Tax=Caulobacter sp. 602-2 TaxID=2710887 RepID=UPI003211F44C